MRSNEDETAIRDAAAEWIVRRDRGLSATEAIEFELWLAADPRHREVLQSADAAWGILERVPERTAERELAGTDRPAANRRRLAFWSSLATAAALMVGAFFWWRADSAAMALVAAGPREVTLGDGTLVRLNSGSEVVEDFDAAERRVRLTRGEAHFTVVKNSAWPFVVVAGAVRVQAVGTAFNVNLQPSRTEVVVNEGRVRVIPRGKPAAEEPLVEAGERAIVAVRNSGAEPSIVVARIDEAEMKRTLAWHDSLVRLGGVTVAELAADCERRFGQRIVIAEPEIARLRAGGRARVDDAEDFADLVATTFDLDVERRADGAWVLRRKKSNLR